MAAHRVIHATRLAGYAAIRAGATGDRADADLARDHPGLERRPFAAATLAFGLAYEAAVLDWFDELDRILPAAPATGNEA